MKVRYDYKIIIDDIENSIESGALIPEATIQIRRGEIVSRTNLFGKKTGQFDYRPIIRWYYEKSYMKELIESDMVYDEIHDVEDISDNYYDYFNDIPYLQDITIQECLDEMRKHHEAAKP